MNQDHHSQYLSSGPSELDSQSDSDWLDVASSRESDDNDSVQSDRDEVHSVPLSRRSSVSFGSSGEGDVEAWEGFVEDSADERPPLVQLGMYPDPPVEAGAQPDNLDAADAQDADEDERIKEGLEQSLISTLSASRSSSGAHNSSTHASLRDLRLSFPDPLTSSKDNLPLSRPATPPSDEFVDELTSVPTTVELSDTATVATCKPESEPGKAITTPEIPQFRKRDIDIDIVLYGFSPVSKWTLIEELLRKAASFTHRNLSSALPSADAAHFFIEPQLEAVRPNGVAVHDCTQGASIHSTSSNPDRPSLAVVFLPSDSLHALPEHNLYLPIFVDDSADVLGNDVNLRASAERTWKMLSVPSGKTLRLGGHIGSPMIFGSELGNTNSFRVHRALQRLVLRNKKQPVKTISDHLSCVPAVTIFALVSIVMSFAINTVFRPPEPTPVSICRVRGANNPWGMMNTQVNNTLASQSTSTSQQGNALIASSLKDFALAIINPPSTALSIISQSSAFSASEPASPKTISCKDIQPPTHVAGTPPSTDIILRSAPVTTVPHILTKPTAVAGVTNKKEHVVPSDSTLTIRMVDSVSEVIEATVKAALDAVHSDLKELIDAMDDLMRAIHGQTKKAMAKSANTAHSIREHVMYRNERARGKAREIKEKSEKLIQSAGEQLAETTWSMKMRGEKFVMFAQEHIKGRTTVAKEKAYGLRKRLVNSDAWVKRVLNKEAARREYRKWAKRGERIKGRRERRKSAKGRVFPV